MNLWTVDSNGKLQPVGHVAAKQQVGDVVRDPERNSLYRVYLGLYGKLRWWYLGPIAQS